MWSLQLAFLLLLIVLTYIGYQFLRGWFKDFFEASSIEEKSKKLD